jgi:multiple sugar transport system permease protein
MRHVSKAKSIPVYFLLGAMGLVFAFPFYYVFVLATWPAQSVLAFPPHFFFGRGLLENWEQLIARIPFASNYFNSFGIAACSTVTVMFFCTMAGFGFAKYRFRFRSGLYAFVVGTMAIPGFLNIIPYYKMMVSFNWINTWLPLIVPGMASAFGIFLMTQFLENSIPEELLDASRIDGLTEFGILLRIVFPLAKPGLAVLAIITFVGSWNNFTGPLILLPRVKSTTLPVALTVLNSRVDNNLGALMLGNALTLLPLILTFAFFSKQIISGLTAGAVKQ